MDNKQQLMRVLKEMLTNPNAKLRDYEPQRLSLTFELDGKKLQEAFRLTVSKNPSEHSYELTFFHDNVGDFVCLSEVVNNHEAATLDWMALLQQVDAVYRDRSHLQKKHSLAAFASQFGKN